MKRTKLVFALTAALASTTASAMDNNFAIVSVGLTFGGPSKPTPAVGFVLNHGNAQLRTIFTGRNQAGVGLGLTTDGADVAGAAFVGVIGGNGVPAHVVPGTALTWQPSGRLMTASVESWGLEINAATIGQRIGYSKPHDPAPAVHVDNTALPPISTEPVPPGATGPQTPPVASGEGIDPSADPVLTGPGTDATSPGNDPNTGLPVEPAPTCPSQPAPSVGGVTARNGFGDGTAPGQGAQHANDNAAQGTGNPNRAHWGDA